MWKCGNQIIKFVMAIVSPFDKGDQMCRIFQQLVGRGKSLRLSVFEDQADNIAKQLWLWRKNLAALWLATVGV